MKKASFLAVIGIVAALVQSSTSSFAAPASGNIGMTFFGSLRTPLGQNGLITCSATAFLVPNTTSAPTISALSAAILANSALSSQAVGASISASRQNFSCVLTLPFLFNEVLAGQNLAISWSVAVRDESTVNLATNPPTIVPGSGSRRTRQVIPNLNPVTQNLPLINVYL